MPNVWSVHFIGMCPCKLVERYRTKEFGRTPVTIVTRVCDALVREGIAASPGVPLRMHTTFRIGGPASILALPTDREELRALWRACAETGIPCRVLGSGANLLIRDQGVP